ncbi:hypothetical protein VB620_11655 [Nodularia harveyana UHCC-0300]|uniref:Uncharacterized protein n=1 Tax=Nodularia harveyana UHCC-0300 TaxID=2974287 RepID=A0ABU5UFP9_9CYAN|nr:hypothetical protein [Nodularia harveyana]MEA5581994.1 hypothetical protein [Nodularia harveyana UHCC-0300]
MTNLEEIFNQLPQMVLSLQLNLGNSEQITQQVTLINNIQLQLSYLQTIIIEELKSAIINNYSIHNLPPIGTIKTLFLDHIFPGETEINAHRKYITAKFGNPSTEISINDLQSKIDDWIEWGDFLRFLAADILNDSQLISQLNSHSHHSNLSAEVQNLSENLEINLALNNSDILAQQIQQLRNAQRETLQVKETLITITNSINLSPKFLTILTGLSSFYGQSSFTLEWLDDHQELIISSNSNFQELTDIVQEFQELQKNVYILNAQLNSLIQKAEKSLRHLSKKRQRKTVINYPSKIISKLKSSKIFYPLLIVASSLLVLISTGLISQQRNTSVSPPVLTSRQESTAVASFKSALQLGREASALVENPPYPVTVWEEAETKWLQAIDLLMSIPPGASVYTPANERLFRYRRNRLAISEKVLAEEQATKDLQTAQKLATEATFFLQNSQQSALALLQAKAKWEEAIYLLENIPQSTSIYPEAQELLPIYQSNYAGVLILIKD